MVCKIAQQRTQPRCPWKNSLSDRTFAGQHLKIKQKACVLSCVCVLSRILCIIMCLCVHCVCMSESVCVCVCLCVHACVHVCVSACVNLKHLSQYFHTLLFLVSDWHACQQQICGVLQEMTSDSMTQDHSHDMSNHSRSFGISAQFGKRCDVLPLFMQNLVPST